MCFWRVQTLSVSVSRIRTQSEDGFWMQKCAPPVWITPGIGSLGRTVMPKEKLPTMSATTPLEEGETLSGTRPGREDNLAADGEGTDKCGNRKKPIAVQVTWPPCTKSLGPGWQHPCVACGALLLPPAASCMLHPTFSWICSSSDGILID